MKHIPQRTCIVCREQKDKSELVRIVKNSEGVVLADESGKAAGRGAYVCKCRDCVEQLVKKRALNRAFKTQLPAEVYEKLGEALGALL